MALPPPRKRFVNIMLLIIAVAALVWALLRVYDMVQDHRQAQLVTPTAPV